MQSEYEAINETMADLRNKLMQAVHKHYITIFIEIYDSITVNDNISIWQCDIDTHTHIY